MEETEIAMGAPMCVDADVEGLDLTDCAPCNCECGEERLIDPMAGAGGLTAVDANNTQEHPASEEPAGGLIDYGTGPSCEDECANDFDAPDCGAVATVGCVSPLPGVAIGKVELVLPDEGKALSYSESKMFAKHKSKLLQLVAKEDLHIKYYDGYETKETTVPAGTRGGYVSKDFRVVNSWVNCSSIILETSLENSYVLDSTIFGRGYIEDSFVSGCIAESYACLDIKKSSLVDLRLEGEKCLISQSFLRDGIVSSSSIIECRQLRGFEITRSNVENASYINHFIVDGAGIGNLSEDFMQITNVGGSNRILCAYKTPRPSQ